MKFDLRPVGQIVSLHGFKGHVKIKLLNPLKESWFNKPLFLILHEQPVPFFAQELLVNKYPYLIIKFKDFNSDTDAQKIKGCKVLADVELILPENEYEYLLGWTFKDLTTGYVGTINEVFQNQSQTLLKGVIEGKEVFIPLVKEFIQNINSEKQEVVFVLPEGLLDLYLI